MKKRWAKMCLVVLLSLNLVACKGTRHKGDVNLKVAVLTWITGIDENCFNTQAWLGVQQFVKDFHMNQDLMEAINTMDEKMAIVDISRLADEGTDLIVLMGHQFIEPLDYVASRYPDQKFLLIDCVVDQPNVKSATFANHEGSFLAGVTAALRASEMGSTKVGFIGGAESEAVHDFETGFVAGVNEIDADIEVDIRYANDFANPFAGKEIAKTMYEDGCSVLFAVAGATGNGVIEEACERNLAGQEVYVVGVDMDQYEDGMYDDVHSCVLTSVLKHVDVPVYDALEDVLYGSFTSGTCLYKMKNGGISLPLKNPNLTNSEKQAIHLYMDQILRNELLVVRE